MRARFHLAALAVLTTGCNPLVYDKILEDAPVFEFKITGPSGSIHRHVAVIAPEVEGEPAHALVGSARGVGLAYVSLNSAGTPVTDVIDNKRADDIAFPIESTVDIVMGGLALVPDETGATAPQALVALLSPNEPHLSRIVRIRPSDFLRVKAHTDDIEAPKVQDVAIPGFASSLAAINLDGPQSEPLYEVATGSEQGLLIFDSLGNNLDAYRQAADSLEFNVPGSCSGTNEPNCFGFTRCEDLGSENGLIAGLLADGGDAAFVVGTSAGLTFVTASNPPAPNAIGVPQYDCAADARPAPAGASPEFGAGLLAHDFDGDGALDLAVGDPGNNEVHIYRRVGGALEDMPSQKIVPDDETITGFGQALGTADLGGNLGGVFLVGAPRSAVDGKDTVGTALVYELDVFSAPFEPIIDLRDLTPEAGTEHGTWVGGLNIGTRDELLVMGRNEGRVHKKLSGLDPAPGEPEMP